MTPCPIHEAPVTRPDLPKLSGLGRDELMSKLAEAHELAERAKAMLAAKDAEIARLSRHADELVKNLTSTQERCTELIQAHSSSVVYERFMRESGRGEDPESSLTMAFARIAGTIVRMREIDPTTSDARLVVAVGRYVELRLAEISAYAMWDRAERIEDRRKWQDAQEKSRDALLVVAAITVRLYLGEGDA